jgi:hypothetical protein
MFIILERVILKFLELISKICETFFKSFFKKYPDDSVFTKIWRLFQLFGQRLHTLLNSLENQLSNDTKFEHKKTKSKSEINYVRKISIWTQCGMCENKQRRSFVRKKNEKKFIQYYSQMFLPFSHSTSFTADVDFFFRLFHISTYYAAFYFVLFLL